MMMGVYTGIKDKNGEDIVEGHTVKGTAVVGIFWKEVVGKVVLCEGYYALVGQGVHLELYEVRGREIVK